MLSGLSDAELLDEVRDGDHDAYAVLFSRHREVALRVANRATPDPHLAEDAVEDAFISVLGAIQRGSGPKNVFAPYLMSSVQRATYRLNRKSMREPVVLDAAPYDVPTESELGDGSSFDSAAARNAFTALPARWREVIWYLDIEEMKPQQAAPLLGLSPNATVALHRRAKDGLRLGYLQQHLNENGPEECRDFATEIPAMVMGTLPARRKSKVEEHMGTCSSCTGILAEINDAKTFRGVFLGLLAVIPLSELYGSDEPAQNTPEPSDSPAWKPWTAAGLAAVAAVSLVAGLGSLKPWEAPLAAAAPAPSADGPTMQTSASTPAHTAALILNRHANDMVSAHLSINLGTTPVMGDTLRFEAGPGAIVTEASGIAAKGWECGVDAAGQLKCFSPAGGSASTLEMAIEISRPSCTVSGSSSAVLSTAGREETIMRWKAPCVPQ